MRLFSEQRVSQLTLVLWLGLCYGVGAKTFPVIVSLFEDNRFGSYRSPQEQALVSIMGGVFFLAIGGLLWHSGRGAGWGRIVEAIFELLTERPGWMVLLLIALIGWMLYFAIRWD